MSGDAQHFVGNVSFGPARSSLWEEQPSVRELYDQACAGLVRAECEVEELRAEVALLRAEREIMASEINGYRDEACRESCRDKAAADGGWANI
jgi:hypothetical protein